MAKATYLYNSGFAVETEKHFFVFDYYLDHVDEGKRDAGSGVLSARDFPEDKEIFVLVSHRHADHFNPVIFRWRKALGEEKVHIILSFDVSTREDAQRIAPGETLPIGSDGTVRAFGSTDEGVSFLVECDGEKIFHAGDLNLWHWQEESTAAQVAQAKKAFLIEMEPIKAAAKGADIAFFPVDPRQGKGYAAGARHFLHEVQPKVFVPMHFGTAFETAAEFAKSAAEEGLCRDVWAVTRRGETREF